MWGFAVSAVAPLFLTAHAPAPSTSTAAIPPTTGTILRFGRGAAVRVTASTFCGAATGDGIALIRFAANLTKSAATTDQAKQEEFKNQGCNALKRVEQIAERTTKKDLVASKLADICSI